VVTIEELTAGARKTTDGKVSATDVIMVVKKCTRNNASRILRNLQEEERIPVLDVAIFGEASLASPNSGRGGNRLPEAAADIRQMVQILWALPGDTEFRRNSADVVVRYLGGDPRMVNEILANRAAQETLAREDPSHPARIFGEAVEAESSAAGDHAPASLKRRREDAEIAKIEADQAAFLEECAARQAEARARQEEAVARQKEAVVRQEEAKAKKLTAQGAVEAAEHALTQQRHQRQLADAEFQRQAQLQEAWQMTELRSQVAAGEISEDAARGLLPTRRRVALERFVGTQLRGDLSSYRARLQAMRKTETGLASELGRRAKASLQTRTRFLSKPHGDTVDGTVTWYEEDQAELFELTREILDAWTALPPGQTTLSVSIAR